MRTEKNWYANGAKLLIGSLMNNPINTLVQLNNGLQPASFDCTFEDSRSMISTYRQYVRSKKDVLYHFWSAK